jgi:hypothetical protein
MPALQEQKPVMATCNADIPECHPVNQNRALVD